MVSGPDVYRNADGKLLFVSTSHNVKGMPVELEEVIRLESPYSVVDVGAAARRAIAICERTPLVDGEMGYDVLLKETGLRSIRAVGKEWKCASVVHFPGGENNLPSRLKDKGIRIQGCRFESGNYYGGVKDPTASLPLDCSNEELGAAILGVFERIVA